MKLKLSPLALLALATTTFAQTPNYTVKNLGALNGQSEAFAINNAGVAVGWSFTATGTRQAVTFANNVVTPLATPANTNSMALGIATNGQVVGKLGTQAARWTSNVAYRLLGTLGGQESAARGINENGVIVGSAQNGQAQWKPTMLQLPNGTQTMLGMLGGVQGAVAACSNGNLAGWSDLANGQTHATLWANGNVLDYGTLGGPASQFLGSSDSGQACGWSFLADRHNTPSNRGNIRRAMVMGSGRTLKSLGEPYMARPYPTVFGAYRGFVFSYFDRGVRKSANVVGVDVEATDLNSDTVVGNATLYLATGGMLKRAVAWINGKFVDLTNATSAQGWTLQLAWGINKKGQIVGQGQAPNGGLIAYRLDPPTPSASGLAFSRFTGWTNNATTPTYANTISAASIPTVNLYVRKSDGMVSTSPSGPFTSTGLVTWNQTDPARPNVRVRLTIDERGAPVSPNGIANWNSVCNGLQSAYAGFVTGQDGSMRVRWMGTNMRDVLNAFPNDQVLQSRWRFSTTGGEWLSIRLRVHKGPGY